MLTTGELGDEQKPRCQNCTERGLDCRYGLRLTFLANNVSNLGPVDAQAFQDITPSFYRQIRVKTTLRKASEYEYANHFRQFVNGLDDADTVIDDDHEQYEDTRSLRVTPDSGSETREIDRSTSQAIHRNPASPRSEPRSQSEGQFSHGNDDEVIIEDQGTQTNNYSTFERPQQASAIYPSVTVDSHTRPPINNQESSALTEAPNYDRAISNRLSSQQSRPMFSLSSGMEVGSSGTFDYSMNSHFSTLSRNSRSPGLEYGLSHPILESKRQNQLLKFYVDEVAPRVSYSRKDASLSPPLLAILMIT